MRKIHLHTIYTETVYTAVTNTAVVLADGYLSLDELTKAVNEELESHGWLDDPSIKVYVKESRIIGTI